MGLPTTNRQYLAALLALITAFLNNEPDATPPVLGDPLPHPDNNGTKIHPNGAVELPNGTLQFPNAPSGTNTDGSQVNQEENEPTSVDDSWIPGTRVRIKGNTTFTMTVVEGGNRKQGLVAVDGYQDDEGTKYPTKLMTWTDLELA